MPITSSAKKAIRSSARKKVFNDRRRRVLREVTKEIKKLLVEKKRDEALRLLSKAYKAIDKAAKTNVIDKNTAARKKSRLSRVLSKS